MALKVIKKPMNKPAKEDVLNLQAEITVQCSVSDMGRDRAPEIYGYFHANKYICLILEYAPGGNLLKILKANSLSEGKFACIIHQLCDIVQFTHALNVLHQDIKPDNILLGANNKILLADFGISAYSLNPRYTICGTLEYMAPEFMENYNHEHINAVDIWSLGIVFYKLFNGIDKRVCFYVNNFIIWGQVNCVPEDARQLISQMLRRDLREHISAEAALRHCFLLNN